MSQIYLTFSVSEDVFPGTGSWARVSRRNAPGFVPVSYTPAMEKYIRQDAAGDEWFHVLDRYGNVVAPDYPVT